MTKLEIVSLATDLGYSDISTSMTKADIISKFMKQQGE
jgi:hypothetical protein